MLKPVIPPAPTAEKMNPPTIAPTMPRTMSRKKPSPDLFTILLAMNPAISPRKIQPIIDIAHPFYLVWLGRLTHKWPYSYSHLPVHCRDYHPLASGKQQSVTATQLTPEADAGRLAGRGGPA